MIQKFVEILGKRGQAMAIPLTPTNAAEATNTPTVITIDPEDTASVILFGVSAYYSTTGRGTVTATDGTKTFKWGLTDEAFYNMENPIQFGTGATVTVTLSALSGAVGNLGTLHAITSGVGG